MLHPHEQWIVRVEADHARSGGTLSARSNSSKLGEAVRAIDAPSVIDPVVLQPAALGGKKPDELVEPEGDMQLGCDPPVGAEHLVRCECPPREHRIGQTRVRSVLPLDRDPVFEQLLQLVEGECPIGRFVSAAALDTSTGEALQVLHEAIFDRVAVVLLEHPSQPIECPARRARRSRRPLLAELAQRHADTRVNVTFAAVEVPRVHKPEHTFPAVTVELAADRLQRGHGSQTRHCRAHALKEELGRLPAVDRSLDHGELLGPRIDNASLVLVQSVEDAGRRACRRVGAIRMPGHVRQPDQLIGVDHSREASLQRAESDMAVVSRDDDEPLLIPGQRHTDADPHDHAAFATVVNDKRRDESKTRSRHHSAE